MYTVTRTQIRPNTNIEFANFLSSFITDEARQYYVDNYKLPGKCILVDINITENDTKYTSVMYWDSEQSYNDFINDPYIIENLFGPVMAYINANNIIFTIER